MLLLLLMLADKANYVAGGPAVDPPIDGLVGIAIDGEALTIDEQILVT